MIINLITKMTMKMEIKKNSAYNKQQEKEVNEIMNNLKIAIEELINETNINYNNVNKDDIIYQDDFDHDEDFDDEDDSCMTEDELLEILISALNKNNDEDIKTEDEKKINKEMQDYAKNDKFLKSLIDNDKTNLTVFRCPEETFEQCKDLHQFDLKNQLTKEVEKNAYLVELLKEAIDILQTYVTFSNEVLTDYIQEVRDVIK